MEIILIMKKITVNASKRYNILIEKGIIGDCGKYISEVTNAKKIAVVTDDRVNEFYSDTVVKSLKNAGFEVCKYVFPHGEKSKCSDVLNDVYMFLSENNITRSDCLVALGGGVVGDLTGYASATYLRGLEYIQIPTTLLAQVDSSVGGKTAIDLPCGKNLVGAFKQPLLVLCDTDTLKTLDEEFFIDGMGEVVKYGMIKSEQLFNKLSEHNLSDIQDILDDVICECISIKRDIVEADEFDKGERMILNFGHTLGHSIEKYYNYTGISHGKAVAEGMKLITEIAEKDGVCFAGTYDRLVSCLSNYRLNLSNIPPVNELAGACLNDKKRDGGSISIIVCSDVGETKIIKMTVEKFLLFVNL